MFGVSSGKGGLGWYIYENKNMLDIPAVFAGLFTVILIGLIVENLIFRNIEAATVRRWGMQSSGRKRGYEITFAFLRKPQTSTTGLPPKSRSR